MSTPPHPPLCQPPPTPFPQEEKRSYLQLDDGVEVEEDTTGGPDGHDRPSAAGKEGGVPGSEQQYAARIRIGGRPLNLKQSYAVALPRNLIKGAFKIQPLIDFGKAHAAELPTEDRCAARRRRTEQQPALPNPRRVASHLLTAAHPNQGG